MGHLCGLTVLLLSGRCGRTDVAATFGHRGLREASIMTGLPARRAARNTAGFRLFRCQLAWAANIRIAGCVAVVQQAPSRVLGQSWRAI